MHIKKKWRWRLLAAMAVLPAVLTGQDRTRISNIQERPERYSGEEVTIVGQVSALAGGTGAGTYEVDDGSGKLWVVSNRLDAPAQGARVSVTGLVDGRTQLGSNALPTVLQELRRHEGGE